LLEAMESRRFAELGVHRVQKLNHVTTHRRPAGKQKKYGN
jgi:hypothetical protein